jgi:superfamily II DNA or RNA helicase
MSSLSCWDDLESNMDDKGDDNTNNSSDLDEESTVIDKYNYTPISTSTPPNKILITKTGAFIKYSDISTADGSEISIAKAVKKLENYFTLHTKLITGNLKTTKRCTVDRKGRRIIVPRFGIYEVLNSRFGLTNYTTKSQLSAGQDVVFELNEAIKLTHNQTLVAKHIMKNIYTKQRVALGSAGLILNLEAGQGKSYLAAYLMSVIKKRTIIIVHSTSMIEQWTKVLNICYPDLSVGLYYGKKKKLGDVMLLVIDSASSEVFKFGSEKKGTYQEIPAIDFYNQFGFAVFDECHEYCNQSDGKVFKYAQTPYMLGLSATPDENANKWDKIAWWSIGPILCADELTGYQETKTNFKATVHRIMYYGHPDYTRHILNAKTGTTSTSETIGMITSEETRNKLVIKCILDCMDQKLYTYVFADRREYLEQLKELLKEATAQDAAIVTSDKEFIRLVGGSSNQDLEDAEVKSKIIFTTYAYGGTGRSIIKMNALVFATPRKSKMKQTVGRILRLGSDETIERQIYDIVDMKLKLNNQWHTRLKYYKSRSFVVEESKYTYDWETKKELEGLKKGKVVSKAVVDTDSNKAVNADNSIDVDIEETNKELAELESKKSKEAKKTLKKLDYSGLSLSIFNKLKD